MLKRTLGICALTVVFAVPASAATIYTPIGIVAPPAFLGSAEMTPFADDTRANGLTETEVASPLGGVVTFSSSLTHGEIGDGWATWSHGYAGDVYFFQELKEQPFGGGDPYYSLTMALPAGTAAFYFYAQPDPFGIHSIAVKTPGSAWIYQDVAGAGGAWGFGFTGGVTQIEVASLDDFGVGEFGISQTPEPASLFLLGTGMVGLAARARRRRSSR